MRASTWRAIIVGLGVWLLLGVGPSAHAFFPLGAYDQFDRLEVFHWSWAALRDLNNDGDIQSPDEGLDILMESGPLGFTDDELEIVRESFQVWQDVPTSYIGFHLIGPSPDPLPLAEGVIDGINSVSMEVANDLVTVGVGGGVLGLTILTFQVDEGLFPEGFPVQVQTSPGQIMEADIVIDAEAHRPAGPGLLPLAELKSTLVHEIGHLVGLTHTPLNNVDLLTVGELPALLESPVVTLRDPTNTRRLVGATPTLFPVYFLVDDGAGHQVGGQADLAPDDIAGVTFLYPRPSQDNFFTVQSEARTQTNPNLPSIPNVGGHVVAWCDVDNDPYTPRIPLFSTMAGVYEIQPLLAGRFLMYNMYKVLESMAGVEPFQATYTFTVSPINELSFTRQAPIGYLPEDFASIDGAVTPLPPAFPSEVFHEQGNIFDVAKHDLGTAFLFDETRSSFVSVTSGKTLPTILAGSRPMFGDRNDVCPLNVAISATLGGPLQFPTALRGLRDRVLLKTAVGTALVDAYYHVSPTLARFLLEHIRVLKAVRAGMSGIEWCLGHLQAVGVLLLALGALVLFRRRRVMAAACLAIALSILSAPAFASILNLSEEDMVRMSDQVVTGQVLSVASQWVERSGRPRIVTDVAIELNDAVKGGLNKSSTIYMRLLGGRVGAFMTVASELPKFKEGEELLLYLQNDGEGGYAVVGGRRGKFEVSTDTSTGEKYLTASSPEARAALNAVAKKALPTAKRQTNADDSRVPLDVYKQHLRTIVKDQEQNQK